MLASRIRSLQRIATLQDTLFSILDNVFEGIITIDEAGIIQSYNKAAEQIFGYAAAETIGSNVKMLMPSPNADKHDGYMARYLDERTPRVIGIGRKTRGLRKNGETFPMRLAITEVRRGCDSLFIGLVSDISKEEEARQRIEFLALHDPLTGLPNRAYFNDVLNTALKTADHGRYAVLFIDLDSFKPLNDSLSHEAGDEALKIVARRLRHELASGDFVARLGGDEFVAIAQDIADAEDAVAIANRLLEAITRPMTLFGTSSGVGASIGIALIPQHGTAASEILTAADNAMYTAKRAGKGRVALAG